MTRDEAKQYVKWVEISSYNLIGKDANDFFNIVKAFSEGKTISFNDNSTTNISPRVNFDNNIKLYKVVESTRKVNVEFTDEQINKIEEILGKKI